VVAADDVLAVVLRGENGSALVAVSVAEPTELVEGAPLMLTESPGSGWFVKTADPVRGEVFVEDPVSRRWGVYALDVATLSWSPRALQVPTSGFVDAALVDRGVLYVRTRQADLPFGPLLDDAVSLTTGESLGASLVPESFGDNGRLSPGRRSLWFGDFDELTRVPWPPVPGVLPLTYPLATGEGPNSFAFDTSGEAVLTIDDDGTTLRLRR